MKAPLEGLSSPEASAAEEVAEKVLSLVGRAFRHDIMSALSSGVLTPEGLKAHFPATTFSRDIRPAQFPRLHRPGKKASGCHSEARFSPRNLSFIGLRLKRDSSLRSE